MFKSVTTAIVLVASTSSAFAMGAIENQVATDAQKIGKLKAFAGEVVQTLVDERAANEALLQKYNDVTGNDQSELSTAVKTGAYGVKYGASFVEEWNEVAEEYSLNTVSGTKLSDGVRSTIINTVDSLAADKAYYEAEYEAAWDRLNAIQGILDNADTTDVDDFISDLRDQIN